MIHALANHAPTIRVHTTYCSIYLNLSEETVGKTAQTHPVEEKNVNHQQFRMQAFLSQCPIKTFLGTHPVHGMAGKKAARRQDLFVEISPSGEPFCVGTAKPLRFPGSCVPRQGYGMV